MGGFFNVTPRAAKVEVAEVSANYELSQAKLKYICWRGEGCG